MVAELVFNFCAMKAFLIFIVILFSVQCSFSQNCTDTSFRIKLSSPNGGLRNNLYYIGKNGISYSAGRYTNLGNNETINYLIKINQFGSVLWAKSFKASKIYSYKIIELPDNNIILSNFSLADQIELLKFDQSGNLIWNKIIQGGANEHFNSPNLQLINDEIYISDYIIPNSGPLASEFLLTLIKLDISGNILWSKYYHNFSCSSFFNLGLVNTGNNSMVLWGRNIPASYCNPPVFADTESSFFSIKLDKASGSILNSKSYMNKKEFGNISSFGLYTEIFSGTAISNNQFAFTNSFRGRELPYENGICKVIFDSNLNIINSKFYTSQVNNAGQYKSNLDKEGNMSMLLYNYSVATNNSLNQYIVKLDSANNIIRQKRLNPIPGSESTYSSKFPFDYKRNYVSLITNFNIADTAVLQLTQLSNDEKNSNCFGEDTSFIQVKPFYFEPYISSYITDAVDYPLNVTNGIATSSDLNVIAEDYCTLVSTCNKLVLDKQTDTICDTNSIYTFSAHLNLACQKHVTWNIDSSAISFSTILNDTTIQLKFKKKWTGYLFSSVNSCSFLKDSLLLHVLATPQNISFGRDTSICSYDSIVLNAGYGFNSYEWQDGSQDSIYIVKQTGTYYVKAVDNCYNIFTDTIKVIVNPAPRLTFQNDTSICTNDSILLDAGNSFKNYLWSNGKTTSLIKVTLPGIYSVIATDSSGCKAADTFKLISNYLLPDLNFSKKSVYCLGQGDTIRIAGSFQSIFWDNGSINPVRHVTAPGMYKVTVGNKNGCVTADSVIITKLVTPSVNFLPADSTYCLDDKVLIKANINFSQYLWSTNERTRSINISKAGLYTLVGTDEHGCLGTDSTKIKLIPCPETIYFPNSFTPNNDGINDLFKPTIIPPLAYYHFQIYNRYGQKVFETNNPHKGWDGRVNNADQNTGSFIWQCRYRFATKNTLQQQGSFILIR